MIPTLRVGDSSAFSVSLPGEAGRALRFVLAGPQQITITSVEREDAPGEFDIALTSGTTSAYSAGSYYYYALSELDGDRRTIWQGTVEILPDITAATVPLDVRSHAQRMLDAIQALLEGRIVKDAETYSIRGRSLTRIPMAELLTLRDKYSAEVRRERVAAGIATPSRIRPVFVR